ncbi:hypothetical protein GCM10010521_12400 [Streptomyces rameus]|uniref:Tetracyclin repressor-like C-terminal domain-containing protein n=2 Tax=Streptomyces TaxID=1883 RepID=A0ABP6MVS3_9ACTN
MRRLREALLNQIADALRPAVTTAVERGQLRPGVTPEIFAMASTGPLFFERFFAGNHLGRDTVDAVLTSRAAQDTRLSAGESTRRRFAAPACTARQGSGSGAQRAHGRR